MIHSDRTSVREVARDGEIVGLENRTGPKI